MIHEQSYSQDEIEYFNRQHEEEMEAAIAQCVMRDEIISELRAALEKATNLISNVADGYGWNAIAKELRDTLSKRCASRID